MLEKNKADSRKYFIFKIRDLVHNSFHTLEEKRTESLLQYMGICISTYDELSIVAQLSRQKSKIFIMN